MISEQSVWSLLEKIWGYLSPRRHRQFFLIIFLTVITALFEIVSLGAVIPFISAITAPEKLLEYDVVLYFAEIFGVTNGSDLVVPIAVIFALAAIISGSLRLLLLWGSLQLGNGCGLDMAVEIYRKTLYQPYVIHIQRSSSEIISGITLKVAASAGVLLSVILLITSSLLCIAIVSTLISVNPLIAFSTAAIFISIYAIIAKITRHRLEYNSVITAKAQSAIVKFLQEGLSSIRDVILDGTQPVYVNYYKEAASKLRLAQTQNAFINQFPRFILESTALVLISIFVLVLNSGNGSISNSLPLLAMLALGAQRLLPIIQQIYGNWSVVVGSHAGLLDVLSLLEQPLLEKSAMIPVEPMELSRSIDFKNLSFKYEPNSPMVIKNISFSIPKGARVGIIGTTGSGKSTVLDLLMGLLKPYSGSILVDNKEIDTDILRASWQRSLSHVPQNIYLTDSSIAENIAFGIALEDIDFDRVKKAAEQAQISEFIESKAEGYKSVVGERGIALSGGQRQRIGIARSLYKDASVILFDEATSALDDRTEEAVMNTINSLSSDLTMFIIAHRLSTLKNCSHIIDFKEGKINRFGNYQDLINEKD